MQRNDSTVASPTCDSHVARHLAREKVVWLGTSGPLGTPGLVPIWFVWDGSAFLIFSKPDARKVRNIRTNPNVVLALGNPAADFDVQLVKGRAELLDRPTAELVPATMLAKYRREMRAIGLNGDDYARTYSQPIRVTPTRFLEWHGRSHLAATRSPSAPGRLASLRRLAPRLPRLTLPEHVPASVLIGGTAWAPLPPPAR